MTDTEKKDWNNTEEEEGMPSPTRLKSQARGCRGIEKDSSSLLQFLRWFLRFRRIERWRTASSPARSQCSDGSLGDIGRSVQREFHRSKRSKEKGSPLLRLQVVRAKPVAKQTAGSRQCNCRVEMRTIPMGGGRVTSSRWSMADRAVPRVLVPNDAGRSLRWLSEYQVEFAVSFLRSLVFPRTDRFVIEEKVLEVEVETGVDDGHEITFLSEGLRALEMWPRRMGLSRRTSHRRWTGGSEVCHSGAKVSDIRLILSSEASGFRHRYFERRNNDLYTNVTITLQSALNGFDLSITHLDGHQVKIQQDQITRPGSIIKKKGEGLPAHEQNNIRGDLYITFDVDFPQGELKDEQREGNWTLHPLFIFHSRSSVIRTLLHQQSTHQLYNGI